MSEDIPSSKGADKEVRCSVKLHPNVLELTTTEPCAPPLPHFFLTFLCLITVVLSRGRDYDALMIK